MEIEFLSIKDFAEAAGKTQQAIYKRIANTADDLQQFIKVIDGKKCISAAALTSIYNIPLKQEPQPQEQPKEESSMGKVVDILKEQIEAQRKDIAEKNDLINNLSLQLENALKLVSQEQQLNYANTQKILALEAAAAEKEEAAAAIIETQKKSFFSLFRKKGNSGK